MQLLNIDTDLKKCVFFVMSQIPDFKMEMEIYSDLILQTQILFTSGLVLK